MKPCSNRESEVDGKLPCNTLAEGSWALLIRASLPLGRSRCRALSASFGSGMEKTDLSQGVRASGCRGMLWGLMLGIRWIPAAPYKDHLISYLRDAGSEWFTLVILLVPDSRLQRTERACFRVFTLLGRSILRRGIAVSIQDRDFQQGIASA